MKPTRPPSQSRTASPFAPVSVATQPCGIGVLLPLVDRRVVSLALHCLIVAEHPPSPTGRSTTGATRNSNIRGLFGCNSCDCSIFGRLILVVSNTRLSMTGFSHVAMHDQMSSDAKEERRECDEIVGHAGSPARNEKGNDRQEHDCAACPHPVFHKFFRPGSGCLFVFHDTLARFFGSLRSFATGFQCGKVNVTNRYKNHCYVR